MPNSHPDEQPVTWGRYEAARSALEERIAAADAAIAVRLDALERTVAGWQDRETAVEIEHKSRIWQAVLAIVTGLVLPLVLIGVVALIHLVRKG